MTKKKETRAQNPSRYDLFVFVVLIIVSLLIRIPFLRSFDIVSYDGTYYINQAKALLGTVQFANSFPIGYPVFVAAALPLVGDGVRAAQIVSLLAGIGSLILFYVLAKHMVRRREAFIAGLILALTPLFVRLSLMTMSESIYIFWLILGLLMFAKGKDLAFGISMGIAAITRPEALGAFAVLAMLRRRGFKRFSVIAVSFVVVYSVNAVVLSSMLDQLILLPKSGFFGSSATPWIEREAWIDFSGKEEADAEIAKQDSETSVVSSYFKRFPHELRLIAHLLPVVSLLALYGIYRKRTFLLAAFVPFLFYPLFSKRTEIRLILPYIPVLILYAMIGVDSVRKERYRLVLYVFLALSTVVGLFVNRDQLEEPVSEGYEWAKPLGAEFEERIGPEDKIGDRKPFFAFYAGGHYTEIPIATYEEVIEHLAAEGVKYLVLHRKTIHHMRPALRPLLYDRAFINGELRFEQIYYYPDNVLVYQRNDVPARPEYHKLEVSENGSSSSPCWSPDGKYIAFRSIAATGEGWIRIVPAEGGAVRTIVTVDGRLDRLSWAPDSKRIAYAVEVEGNLDIYIIDVVSGTTRRVTTDAGSDTSPSWSKDGKEIAFCSNRSGEEQIWVIKLSTGELTQVTSDGAHVQPALSADGSQIACIRPGQGLVVHNRQTGWERGVSAPKQPLFAPAWSPEDRFIAITGEGWGGTDVYLVNPDGGDSLVLTEIGFGDGLPSWSPDGRRMAITSNRDGTTSLWIVTGLEGYKSRLKTPRPIKTVESLE